VARLAERFVCVRIQAMNGVNLDLFPFEYDLTWMAFFMDSDDGISARYGGREDHDAESHLTKESLLRVMRTVLRRHEAGDAGPAQSQAATIRPRTPEDIPTMAAMMATRREKCIHCHDVKVAELRHRQELGTFSRELIFSYPTPATVGIGIGPDAQDRVESVRPGSPAAAAGVRPGDTIVSADGRPILTLGDFARVLERTPREADLPLVLRRGDREVEATLRLSGDWKRTADPSWRASVHVAGPNPGFWAVGLNPAEKRAAQIPAENLALKVTFLFPGHPTPRRAGLSLGDIVVEVDGRREPMTTRQLHAHCQMNHDYGDRLPIVLLRGGRETPLTLELPARPPSAGSASQ
jgi:serine protease Do